MHLITHHSIRPAMIAFAALALSYSGLAASFKHPGVVHNREELEFIRDRIQEDADPWRLAFDEMSESRFASLSYEAGPRPIIECGPYSRPDHGCTEGKNDPIAAYTHALLWVFTGEEDHALKSIEIMNAWSAVLEEHRGHNAPLQSSWSASIFVRAAEIMRHLYDGWEADDIERFSRMMRDGFLPHIVEGRPHYNGNWELSMIEAMVGMGVFLDDRELFEKGVSMWRKRVPAYFYLTRDGELGIPPPEGNKDTRESLIEYWYDQDRFVDGLGQETCRDFGHLQMGLAAMVSAAETALQQGVDLYGEEAERITSAMEFHAGFILGEPVPEWLCDGNLQLSTENTWEIAYNHYHNRLGMELPLSGEVVHTRARPTGAGHHMVWETLTHAELGSRGLPSNDANGSGNAPR